jgi:hypothetical protein
MRDSECGEKRRLTTTNTNEMGNLQASKFKKGKELVSELSANLIRLKSAFKTRNQIKPKERHRFGADILISDANANGMQKNKETTIGKR